MGITFPGESAEYRAARAKLLAKEVELRRSMEAVAVARRALPPGPVVQEDYLFDGLGLNGAPAKVKFSELFARGEDTLLIYNFMFPRHPHDDRPGPREGETTRLKLHEGPCPSCTALLDQFEGAADHLEGAGFNLAIVAKAPLDRLTALARDRGWKNLRLLSAGQNSFQRDYRAEAEDGSAVPLMMVFHRSGDTIRLFWSSELMFEPSDPGQDPRHNGTLEPLWTMMDLTPEGRPDWDEQMAYGDTPAQTTGGAA